MKAPVCVQKKWCIDLTIPQLKRLLDRDDNYDNPNRPFEQMLKVPDVEDINYDGHFGPHIWFTTAADDEETVIKFTELIKKLVR